MSNKLDKKDLDRVSGGAYSDYPVHEGDTLSSISAKLGVPQSVLQKLNNISNLDNIKPGDVLKYPC